MRLQLLGTGSSDGWPNPWCSCASCGAARRPTSSTACWPAGACAPRDGDAVDLPVAA